MLLKIGRDCLSGFATIYDVTLSALTAWQGMAQALYDKLEDGTFAGSIPSCEGVIAFGATLRECEDELRSTLEDWIVVGLKLGHPLPILDGIDLNREITRELMDTL